MNFEAESKIGMSPLEEISKMTIQQQEPALPVPPQFMHNNQYRIVNESGQILYYAFQDFELCWNCTCSRITHAFSVRICDITGSLVKNVKISSSLYFCYKHSERRAFVLESEEFGDCRTVFLRAQNGTLMGSVYHRLDQWPWEVSFTVQGQKNEGLYSIERHSSGEEFHISVMGANQSMSIGQIIGQPERFLKPYRFDITFPPNLPVLHKACLLAAAFAVDSCFGGNRHNKKQRW